MQQNPCHTSRHTLKVLLHCLAKHKRQKVAKFCCTFRNYSCLMFTKLTNVRYKIKYAFILKSCSCHANIALLVMLYCMLYILCVCSACIVFSERELNKYLSSAVRLSVVCLSSVVCRLCVTLAHPTQAIEIFGNISTPCGTLAIHDLCIKILRRSSEGNPSVGGVKHKRVAEYSDFGPLQRYISETVQDRS